MRLSPGTRAESWQTTISIGRLLAGAAELIAHSAHCLKQGAIGFELLAKMADVHIDGAVERSRFAVVETLHQGIAREDASAGVHQRFEDIELESSGLDL